MWRIKTVPLPTKVLAGFVKCSYEVKHLLEKNLHGSKSLQN